MKINLSTELSFIQNLTLYVCIYICRFEWLRSNVALYYIGHLSELGPHAQLMSVPNGIY